MSKTACDDIQNEIDQVKNLPDDDEIKRMIKLSKENK